MSLYDDAAPGVKAAADRALVEVEQAALDVAKVSAMEVGLDLDSEERMLYLTIGVRAGFTATIEWLLKHDLLKRDT